MTDQTEFMQHLPSSTHYIVSAVEEMPVAVTPKRDKLVIGHFPSKSSIQDVKGTVKIMEMLKPFANKFEIRIGTNHVSHSENIRRMADVDIYVELFQPTLEGRQYGCFGVTAIEAAMMGKAVITMDMEFKTHIKTYGPHPFLLANTEGDFDMILRSIHDFGIDQEFIHDTSVEYYSFEATGKRLKKILNLRDWPKVSVMIPFNVDRGWLNDAVASVKEQCYAGEIELLRSDYLVDDHDKMNVSQNINALFPFATGEYIKYMGEDDLLTPNCIHDSVVAMEKQGVDMLHANSFIWLEGRSSEIKTMPVQKPSIQLPTFDQHCEQCYIHGLTLFYHRRIFDAGIRFDETLSCSEENDFNLHAMSKGFKLGYLNKPVCIYRRHRKQKSLGAGVDQNRRKKEVEMIRSRYRKTKQ
ncbi:MAG: glycosyltransferase family 2 protein [Bacteroidia bacterium]